MRKKIAAGNWKMNLNLDESIELAYNIANTNIPKDVSVILGVPFPFLYSCNLHTQSNNRISLAAQNCNENIKGAYTGEVSLTQLKSVGVEYAILGHSERRSLFNESNDLLAKKVKSSLEAKLKVIFCCGEPLEVREKNVQNEYVAKQLEEGLFHLDGASFKNIIVAYEPIWAIGTGKTASPEQAQEMHSYIRKLMTEKYGASTANGVPILYGGSVKPANAKELFSNEDVDGGLVGGASLKSESFAAIINSF